MTAFILIAAIIVIIINSNKAGQSVSEINMMQMHGMSPIKSEEQFIFEMVFHHQEAIDSSRIIQKSTENEELKKLANNIITKQKQEIIMMDEWKINWYGYGNYQVSYMEMMPNLDKYLGDLKDKVFLQ